jgi:tetratricopeptide (TPR) repeat protein
MEAYEESFGLFKSLDSSDTEDLSAMRNLALAHYRLAILKKSQGEISGALSSMRDHREIISRLVELEPENVDLQREQGAAMAHEAVILSMTGEEGDAAGLAAEAVRVLDLLCRRSPTNHRFVSAMTQAAGQWGETLWHSDRVGEAVPVLERACEIAIELANRHPSNAEFASSAGNLLGLLSLCFRLSGDIGRAEAAGRSCVAYYENLVEDSDHHAVWKYQLLLCRTQLAFCLLEGGDTEEASELIDESISTVEMMIADNSNPGQWASLMPSMLSIRANALSALGRVEEAKEILSRIVLQRSSESAATDLVSGQERISVFQQVGDLALQLGEPQEALRHYEEALGIARHWEQKAPRNPGRRKCVGTAGLKTADAFLGMGDYSNSRRAIDLSVGIFEDLASSQTELTDLTNLLVIALERKVELYEALGEFKAAIPVARRVVELAETLGSQHSTNPDFAEELPAAMGRLADILSQAGHLDKAIETARKACAMTAEMHAANPGALKIRSDLAISKGQLAKVLWTSGDSDGAVAAISEAISHFDFLRESLHDQGAHKHAAIAWETLATFQIESDQLAKAAESRREALGRRRSRAAANPESAAFRRSVAVSLDQLAAVEAALGKEDEARNLIGEAIAVLEVLSRSNLLSEEDMDWLDQLRNSL